MSLYRKQFALHISHYLWYFHFQNIVWKSSIVLSVSVKKRMNRERKRFISTTSNKQKQRFKWLNGKWIQTHRRPFVRPNMMQICACTWINHFTKTVKNQDSGPSWAVGCRPLDLWTARPWASGLPATDLPLVKPSIQIFILIGGEHVTCPESKLNTVNVHV